MQFADGRESPELADSMTEPSAVKHSVIDWRWLSVGLALVLGGFVLGAAAARHDTLPADLAIALAIQRPAGAELGYLAWTASRAGDALLALLVVSLIGAAYCALRGRLDLALVLLAATVLRGLGPPLKWLFESARPPIDAVSVFEQADGFGYPSGHAFGAALVYGSIAVVVPQLIERVPLRRAMQALAMAMVVLISLSRVRLGVHWPSDVAGGLAFGLGIVCLLQAALAGFRDRQSNNSAESG